MKVGVIGSGAISEIYLQNMIHLYDNLEVVALASKNPEHAARRAAQFGIPSCTVDELLANPEIEMVVNLTPVGAHYELIRRALLAGKHVYSEKTVTGNFAQAQELLKLADEKGLRLGCAPDTFLGSALQTARAALEDGLLGTVHSFVLSANRNNDILTSVFAFLREPGCGILLDYAVYYITALVSLLGPAERVCGVTSAPYPTRKNIIPMSPEFGQTISTPNESQVSAVVQLRSGAVGTVHLNAETRMQDEAFFALYGTKGILYLSDPNQFGGKVSFLPSAWGSAPAVTLWQFNPNSDNCRGIGPSEMAEAISENRPHRASKEMAAHVLEILEGIQESSRTGSFVSITSRCPMPEPVAPVRVPVVNMGHLGIQMKNDAEMLRFYTDILGMQPLFTMTKGDLGRAMAAGGADVTKEPLRTMLETGDSEPWIRYLKFADRQYLELFPSNGAEMPEPQRGDEVCGYKKVAYEVDDLQAMFDRVVSRGAKVLEPIHPVVDGAMEFALLDPDGNEVQFTSYTGSTLPLTEPEQPHAVCSPIRYTSQVALKVRDDVNMLNFYTRGLGLKHAARLTYADLAAALERGGQDAGQLKLLGSKPWIDYVEVGPHQFIELFYSHAERTAPEKPAKECSGFQHFCLEVNDLEAAWKAALHNGLKPDTEISTGVSGSRQFWLTDPDGNRMEIMFYPENARHLQ